MPIFVATALAIVLCGCSLFGGRTGEVALDPAERALRIEALREAIESDHAKLEALITEPQRRRMEGLDQHPEFEPIATRLGKHELELARLEALESEDSR